MALPQELSKQWQEKSDLTIQEAAIWMVIEADPSDHEFDLEHFENYAEHYEDHPGGKLAVQAKCAILESAVRAEQIKLTPLQQSSVSHVTSKTFIPTSEWMNWCKQNGYSNLSELFSQHHSAAVQLPTSPTALSTTSQTLYPASVAPVAIKSTYTPHNAVGKLTVKAAEEIEEATKKRASAKQVMAKLQEWADGGNEAGTLVASEKSKQSVKWMTDKHIEKLYSMEACTKILQKWTAERQ